MKVTEKPLLARVSAKACSRWVIPEKLVFPKKTYEWLLIELWHKIIIIRGRLPKKIADTVRNSY